MADIITLCFLGPSLLILALLLCWASSCPLVKAQALKALKAQALKNKMLRSMLE
jgi:hypothetical protein